MWLHPFHAFKTGVDCRGVSRGAFHFVSGVGFVAPGLYKHERRLIFPPLVSSSLLFYCGVSFAYFVVFPLVFGFSPPFHSVVWS